LFLAKICWRNAESDCFSALLSQKKRNVFFPCDHTSTFQLVPFTTVITQCTLFGHFYEIFMPKLFIFRKTWTLEWLTGFCVVLYILVWHTAVMVGIRFSSSCEKSYTFTVEHLNPHEDHFDCSTRFLLGSELLPSTVAMFYTATWWLADWYERLTCCCEKTVTLWRLSLCRTSCTVQPSACTLWLFSSFSCFNKGWETLTKKAMIQWMTECQSFNRLKKPLMWQNSRVKRALHSCCQVERLVKWIWMVWSKTHDCCLFLRGSEFWEMRCNYCPVKSWKVTPPPEIQYWIKICSTLMTMSLQGVLDSQ